MGYGGSHERKRPDEVAPIGRARLTAPSHAIHITLAAGRPRPSAPAGAEGRAEVTAHPTASTVTAEAVVNLDGTGTWSIDGGVTEPITASTAAAVRAEVLHRAVIAAAERGAEIELRATFLSLPILLRVSPTGEVVRVEGSGVAPTPDPSPGADLSRESVLERRHRSSGRGPRWVIAAAVVALAAAAVVGLVLVRGSGDDSPSAASAPRTAASPLGARPSTAVEVPAAPPRKLDVTVTAHRGGPLTARVRATAAPTVATLTVRREGRRIARHRLHLPGARTTWSSGTVTFRHVGPGRYRWAVTAPGASRVTGTYRVLARPAPRDHRAEPSTGPGAVGVTPAPTHVPTSSAPASLPPAPQPSPLQPPHPPAHPRPPAPHHGPVPGGSTSSPHLGPRP